MSIVYMVCCADDSLYTGWTTDLSKRILTHNEGKGAKYTRSRLPVTPVYAEICENKNEALKREAEIKHLNRQEKLLLIQSELNQLAMIF